MKKTAINPTRSENYPEWYQQVIAVSELAENSSVRGCMVIKPWGYAIWEQIQQDLDRRFKQTGHQNAYFPLLIPLSHLEKEAQHVAGFAKECAVVTHHRLIDDGAGGLKPDGELEEPLVIRPTSETIIGESFAKWIHSYRDLPLLINQWANIMRWEMRTRLFLRTAEFLWQEGHTAHATAAEAMTETLQMLEVYRSFVSEILAIPVIVGEKPCFERFPGAINTYSIEAMMQDAKALQAGTSHFLGQNFARSANICYNDAQGELQHVWTTSWGVSTRLIGGLIMVHSDDNGLVLPPRIAATQMVIIPIYSGNNQELLFEYCTQLKLELEKLYLHHQPLKIIIDQRDLRGGEKKWQWIKKGVPILIEIGERELKDNQLSYICRDNIETKQIIEYNQFITQASLILEQMQHKLYDKALKFQQQRIYPINSLTEFQQFFGEEQNINSGFARAYAIDEVEIEAYLKPLQVSARCIPFDGQLDELKNCIFTGKLTNKQMIFAKAY